MERRVGGREQEMNQKEGGLGCHHTGGFYYGAAVGSRVRLPLTPPHLCNDSTLPDDAPCGFNDKGVCAAVHERAHALSHIPHPRL